jgi:hypothetical protein
MLGTLKRLPVVERLRAALRQDVEQTLKPLRKEVRRLSKEVEQLEQALRQTAERAARADRQAAQVKSILMSKVAEQQAIDEVAGTLDEHRVAAHVGRAIATAPILSDPFEHVVVERLLPDDVYELLLHAIPPLPFFSDSDPVKQDLPMPMECGSAYHMKIWGFVDAVLAQRIITPAVMARFHEPLQEYYDVIFGPGFREHANGLPPSTSGGRLMLRRPGYHLSPHRDPKRSILTCLLYLAKPGDDEAHGTRLYRVANDREAHYKQTYYPEREGHACALVKVVPFRPNSMLVFLNSKGAHGAGIPDSAPDTTERCSYQFYVAPDNRALAALLKSLPPDRRQMWKNRNKVKSFGSFESFGTFEPF